MREPRTAEASADDAGGPETPAAPERRKGGKRTPELEIAIGARIRAARVAARMSQSVLGEAVGISFQQVQKYELGKDRVAASTLQGIAATLGIHPGSFFDEDMPSPALSPGPTSRSAIADLRGAQRIGERVQQLKDPDLIRRLLALVDVIVEARGGSDVPDSE